MCVLHFLKDPSEDPAFEGRLPSNQMGRLSLHRISWFLYLVVIFEYLYQFIGVSCAAYFHFTESCNFGLTHIVLDGLDLFSIVVLPVNGNVLSVLFSFFK